MDKRDFFIEALQAGAYKYKEWVIGAFTVMMGDDDDADKLDPKAKTGYLAYGRDVNYPYRILRLKDYKGYCFVDTVDEGMIVEIAGSDKTKPLFTLNERILLKRGDLENVDKDIDTLYGNALINAIIFIYPFGNKVPFMTGRISPSQLDKYIAGRLTDNPKADSERSADKLYVDEYLKYCQAVSSLAGLALIGVPAASPKLLTVNPAIRKRRDELFKENADKLHDPAMVAKIEAELVAMDRADFKGDPAEGFLIKSKSFDVARKRAKIMHGVETGFGDTSNGVDPIRTSLSEKWDIEKLPAMVNSLRAGVYNRGHQTALGGESVKFFYRVFQNTRVLEEDCGVKGGMHWDITELNYKSFVGLHRAFPKGIRQTEETSENLSSKPMDETFLKSMIGKSMLIRTPMLCKTKAPSFCARCVGTQIASAPTGVHIAMSDVGSIFMLCFMKAMHGKALQTAFYDFNSAIT